MRIRWAGKEYSSFVSLEVAEVPTAPVCVHFIGFSKS